MRKLTLALLVVSLARTYPSQAQSDSLPASVDPRQLFAHLSPFVYVLEGVDEHGDVVSVASAVSVGRNELVTNKHAINVGGFLRVRRGEKTWPATVDKLDETADLSILQVEGFDAVGLLQIRGPGTLEIGERVIAIGAPFGLELSLSDGLIAGLRHEDAVTLIQTTAPISKGSSGGGLFDAEGRLIGVTTFYLAESQNLNFAVAADRVCALELQGSESTARAWAAVGTEIEENAGRIAGLERSPSGVDPNEWNEWTPRTQARMKVLAQEEKRAVSAYNESVRLNPNDADVWIKLGSLYAALRDTERMKSAFDHALSLRPNDVAILATVGERYDRVGDHDKAAQALREAVRLQPVNADLWVSLADVLKQTDRKGAAEALRHAVEVKPPKAETWVLIGQDYQTLKSYANAEAAYQRAVDLEPTRFNLAFLGYFYALQRRDEAKFRKICDRLREVDPRSAVKLEHAWP